MNLFSRHRYAVLVLAVILPRMAWFSFLGGRLPEPTRDQGIYIEAAGGILEGRGLSYSREQGLLRHMMAGENPLRDSWSSDPDYMFGMVPVETPTASMEPGYPLLLALAVTVAGPFAGSVFLLNCIFALIGALALMRMVTVLWGSRQGLLAALIWSLYPYYIYYGAYAMTETVHVSMLPLVLLLTVESSGGGARRMQGDAPARLWRSAAAGVSTGFLFLVRSTAFFLLPVQMLWLILRRRWKQALMVATGFILCCMPWVVRNQVRLGSPVLMPTKGVLNLWMRNNPEILAMEGIHLPDAVESGISRRELLAYPEMEGLDTELERSRLLMDRAVSFLTANPVLVGYLTLTRAAGFLSPIGGTIDHPAASAAGLIIYTPMLLIGVLEAFRRRKDPHVLLLCATFLLYLALHSLAHGGVRYRLPVDMVPIVLTALFAGRRAGWEKTV
ncbi:MAG: hypothetical protein AVO35_10260 [Candidatus Aegiribacteria sp. MLS_C]|nr:MAG: hypothetical protein AVO35_10260 [Candidatus Aegiribacteria sp. MLS_C]